MKMVGLPHHYKYCSDRSLGLLYQMGDQGAYDVLWKKYQDSLWAQACHLCNSHGDLPKEVLNDLFVHLAKKKVRRKYDYRRPWRPWAGAVLRRVVLKVFRGVRRPCFMLMKTGLNRLKDQGVPQYVLDQLRPLLRRFFPDEISLGNAVGKCLSISDRNRYWLLIRNEAERCGEIGPLTDEQYEPPTDERNELPWTQAWTLELLRALFDCIDALFTAGEFTQDDLDLFRLHFVEDMTFREIAELRGVAVHQVTNRYYRNMRLLRQCLENKGHTEAE